MIFLNRPIPIYKVCLTSEKTTFPLFLYLFIPISLMAEDGGPTNITFRLRHSSANSGFSERKPYPGWIA